MSLGDKGSSSKGIEKPFTALIVDDNSLMLKMHESILKSIGITTQVAHNGKEAVDIFHSGANFDIVFMDMEMPIMNGIEATKELRAMGVVCKIVGVTSCENAAEKEAFKQAGLDILHEKPLTLAKVNSILEQPHN
ncbi:hypothetical protein Ddye_026464 [Dipteronia dyeriana]|uniref:Response regulatory domain-containing protein n=1 Tax=Dipteronia dyeriana TaxID=168575 RepID=A0AAD9WP77_9ROSI|nr:hypothetical protein Ddye_026464 [Dipteronia dyeriana]